MISLNKAWFPVTLFPLGEREWSHLNKLTNQKKFWFLFSGGKMLVFSFAGAPLSVSQDATRAVNLLYCRSPSCHQWNLSHETCAKWWTEQNRTKKSFALFAFEVQIFQLMRNFLTSKPIRLLSWVTWTFNEDHKNFHKMAAPQLCQAWEKIGFSIFSKQELPRLRLVFACDNFSLGR